MEKPGPWGHQEGGLWVGCDMKGSVSGQLCFYNTTTTTALLIQKPAFWHNVGFVCLLGWDVWG